MKHGVFQDSAFRLIFFKFFALHFLAIAHVEACWEIYYALTNRFVFAVFLAIC